MDKRIRRALLAGMSVSLGMLMTAAGWAQSQPATQPDQPSAQQDSQPAAQSASPSQHTIQMVQAQAQLDKTLDTKKAKQGDPVTAKLVQGVQIPDAAALPKNTVLEGHVDQIQASQNKSDAMVTVTFDKAKLKDGKELPIKATVLAVSEPVYAQQQQAQSGGGAPAQMPSASPSGSPSGGSMGNGSSTPAAAPQPQSVPDASQGPSQPTQAHGGVPDVMLKSDIHEHSSATFSSKGRNVHVPDGTQMEFALAVIPAGVTIQ